VENKNLRGIIFMKIQIIYTDGLERLSVFLPFCPFCPYFIYTLYFLFNLRYVLFYFFLIRQYFRSERSERAEFHFKLNTIITVMVDTDEQRTLCEEVRFSLLHYYH